MNMILTPKPMPAQVGMLGYTKHETSGECLQHKVMTEAEVATIETTDGKKDFGTFYTCSLKDLGSVNIAATRLGLPIWEVKSQYRMVTELQKGMSLAPDTIAKAERAICELLKMVTDESGIDSMRGLTL